MSSPLAFKGGRALRDRSFPQWPITDAADQSRLAAVLQSGRWSFDGPVEADFTRQWASYCGSAHALCVANGSVTLEIALRALGIGPGDEVIVPALTWVATAGAVVQVGAVPIFADVRESDWCIDPASIRERITPRTRAIIPVHLYAQMADMDEIMALAQAHKLAVIEDCAHAHGFQWRGRGVGTIGTFGSYSFQQSKTMTAGEGGALLTQDAELADRAYGLKNCGRKRTPDSAHGFGTNLRLTEFQAAVLLGQLGRIDSQLHRKNGNAALLRASLSDLTGVSTLAPKAAVTRHGMYGFPICYEPEAFAGITVELLVEALKAEGVPVQRTYDVVYQSPLWTSGVHYRHGDPQAATTRRLGLDARCPVAERIARQGLVILHHNFLGDATDMADIAAGFAKVQKHAGDLRFDSLKRKIRHVGGELLRQAALIS